MKITAQEIHLQIDNTEATDLFRSILVALKYTIVKHWRFNKSCWPENEKIRLRMLKELSIVTGNNYEWEFKQLMTLLNSDEPL